MSDGDQRDRLARRIIATADKLARAMRGEAIEPEPDDDHDYWAALLQFQRERNAMAEILAQAIELAAPVLEHGARPLGAQCAQGQPLVGAPPWFTQKAKHLSLGQWLVTAPAAQGKVVTGEELFLLENAQLAKVKLVGAWSGDTYVIHVTEATLLEPAAVVMHWDLSVLLINMYVQLELFIGDDARSRRERLRSLIIRSGAALVASIESLEAVVEPG